MSLKTRPRNIAWKIKAKSFKNSTTLSNQKTEKRVRMKMDLHLVTERNSRHLMVDISVQAQNLKKICLISHLENHTLRQK